MDVGEATRSYEDWMRRNTAVIEADLRAKHEEMRGDSFIFLRGTYYRWAELWPEICADLGRTPTVLAVGDLHVGSYGTWRDAEGRLTWGVDDFDESYPLAYTNDLVRLATSVKIVIDFHALAIKLRAGCDAILEGYTQAMAYGGRPFVLAEHFEHLEKLGLGVVKPAEDFWEKLDGCRTVGHGVPRDAKRVLEQSLPSAGMEYRIVRRTAGVGSRGQPRFVAIADCDGGRIAREAKAMVPSASQWVSGKGRRRSYYQEALDGAVRSHDPFQRIHGSWLIRRLAPDSNPIDIMDLPRERDEGRLLHAMGAEAANVHLGSRGAAKRILGDLGRRKPDWLRVAAKAMAKAVARDWKQF
jgi:Uncharacterized protein conserved in bacteria (DUF2252)